MSDHKHAPRLPQVVDEAADTPGWVPALGLGLFALIALVVAVQIAYRDASAAAETPSDDSAASAGAPAP